MKKLLTVLFCMAMALTLCACQANTAEQPQEQTEEITNENYKVTIVVEGGIEKKMEMDASKTPIIHEANELFYKREYSASISKILLALNAGEFDPIIYHRLGYMYKNGFGVDKDIDLAIDFYTKGLEYDQLGCLYNLGVYYTEQKNADKAKEMYEKAIEANVPLGYYGLGYLYFNGFETIKADRTKTEELFAKGVETNDPETLYNVGRFYLSAANTTNEDHIKGIDILNKAIELGYGESCFYIADAYETGKGYEVNPEKAFEYYLKGAEMSPYKDQYDNVGYCYEEGVGVEIDYAKAFEYYKLATTDDFAMAWYDLGRMYENGLGVEKNLGEAIRCYFNASKHPSDCPYAEDKLNEILDSLQ